MTEDHEIGCDHCGTTNPVGGIKSYKREDWVLSKRPNLSPRFSLCQVCEQLLGTVGNMNCTEPDHGVIDQARIANLIRRDIAELRKIVETQK